MLLAACVDAPGRDAPSTTLDEDRAHFGHPDSVLFWTPEQELASFRNYDQLFPVRVMPASPNPFPLPSRPVDLSALRYVVDDATLDLDGFVEHNRVAGLLAIKNGEIVLERYAMGNGPETKWVSYSIAKSVVSLLVGAAIRDGYIGGVDDMVTDYVPLLRGTAYEGVTIRNVLQMASGVEWNEDYTDPDADVSREIGLPHLARIEFLGSHPRVAAPGTRFNYNTAETHLAGSIVRGAIGNNLATYLDAKIWEPFGMEFDGNWRLVEPHGAEHGGCCISATLRDYGRIGMFAMRGGELRDGTRVVPDGWMEESTTPSAGFAGYGYLWWLGEGDAYAAVGIFGQAISIDPDEDLVIVTHSVWPQAPTSQLYSAHRRAFFSALTEALR